MDYSHAYDDKLIKVNLFIAGSQNLDTCLALGDYLVSII